MSDTHPYADGHATFAPPYPAPDPYLPPPLAAVDNPVDGQVVVDLDAYAKPNRKPPFWFRHDGRSWLMRDPGEVDWQQQWAARRDPRLMIRLLLPPDQREDFLSREMPSDKLKHLMASFRTHYELNDDEAGDQPF